MTLRLMALLTYLLAAATYIVGYNLHHSPIRKFTGIGHAFAVTMCRFAFADHPRWLSPMQKLKMEQIVGECSAASVFEGCLPCDTEMASKLSELIIDLPDTETAWSTFQEDAEAGVTETEDVAETEEEREARLLHPEDSD